MPNLSLFQRLEGENASTTVALALRPDSEPWFLLEHALDWAQKLDARLDLCAVLPGLDGTLMSNEVSSIRYWHLGRKHRAVGRWLDVLMAAIPAHRRGITTILEGEPGSALTEYAHNHTLLVLGRPQSRKIFSVFERSVATQLVQRCTIPIAIVGGRRLRPKAVAVLPLLPTEPRLEAVQWVVDHLPDSNLTTIRMASDDEGPGGPIPDSNLVSLLAAPGQRAEIRSRVSTRHGVGRDLARYAKRLDADLVAVPASRRTGLLRWLFGSVVDGLVQNCRCSVLVVPRAE